MLGETALKKSWCDKRTSMIYLWEFLQLLSTDQGKGFFYPCHGWLV